MARIFITGSSDGLGSMAAKLMADQGHKVVLHARNAERGRLATYILTCLIQKPERLIYLSSGMHLQGNPGLNDFSHDTGRYTYADSKLHDLILSMAVARKWKDVYSNAVNPGWVPTKMGGRGAPDDLRKGAETQAWLAVSNDKEAKVSGRYFYHLREKHFLRESDDPVVQEKLLALCEEISGVGFPSE